MGKKYIVELPETDSEFDFASIRPYTAPDLEQVRKEGYNAGLADAWDAARKIAHMSYDEEEEVFGSGGWTFIAKHTANETIEKIRQYEQEKEMDGLRQNIQTIVDKCGYSLDEIATVLEKMREGQDG